MAGNADVRLYRIVAVENPSFFTEIKCLAVKENGAVVSTISSSEGMQEILDEFVKKYGLSYPCKIGEQIEEQIIVEFVIALNLLLTPDLFKLIEVFADRTIYEPEPIEEE